MRISRFRTRRVVIEGEEGEKHDVEYRNIRNIRPEVGMLLSMILAVPTCDPL